MSLTTGFGRAVRAVVLIGLGMLTVPAMAATACQLGTTPYLEPIREGSSVTLYSAPSVPKGSSCDTVAVSATCKAGKLAGAGSARFAGCMSIEGFTGVNLNGKPQLLDPRLLHATGAHWVRAFINVVNAQSADASGMADAQFDSERWKIFRAMGADGTAKTILSLKWDFKTAGIHPPVPGSPEESALFEFLDRQILDPLASTTTIIVTGNEPYFNTAPSDWKPVAAYGGIPLVIFYERVTAHVNDYLIAHGLRDKVKLFVGAFTGLEVPGKQKDPAVKQLLDFADKTPFVDGIDLHTHVISVDKIGTALDFVQSRTSKPIVVSEFTYVFRMKAALAAGNPLGKAFAQKWNLPAGTTELEFLRCEVFHFGPGCSVLQTIPKPEWDDFMKSRPWFQDHFLLATHKIFDAHGVMGATFGLVGVKPVHSELRPDGTPWYLGYLYSPGALGVGPDGLPLPNYQYLDDFRQLNGAAN